MLDWNACPCSGGTLDRLIQPAILVVLADGPLHGYRLAERISRMPSFQGHTPDVSGVYRFLKSMERKGFVESHWDLSATGPAKRSYRITPCGWQCLEKWIETLETHRKGIAGLLREARKVTQH
jgi:DNA-binding PadR family transcriptional regulator